jgi:hypothetical protein
MDISDSETIVAKCDEDELNFLCNTIDAKREAVYNLRYFVFTRFLRRTPPLYS